jgi:hypothetical protein
LTDKEQKHVEMTDLSLFDRLSRMMVKVAPVEIENRTNGNSWSEISKLSTEKKLLAIRISDGEDQFVARAKRKPKKKKSANLLLKKWISKCKWKIPIVILLFSFIQVIFFFSYVSNKQINELFTAFLPPHRPTGPRISNTHLLACS